MKSDGDHESWRSATANAQTVTSINTYKCTMDQELYVTCVQRGSGQPADVAAYINASASGRWT